jgi:RHS repeat-associated protein
VLQEVVDGAKAVEYSYGHDLISQARSGQLSYFNYDGLGSTRSLADATGVITDSYHYEAFGELLNQTGSTENSYLYAGEQFDRSLNQYYLRARYYDQGIGRFTQMDSWQGRQHQPWTLNKYLYGNADPANHIDPTGNFSLGQMMTTVNVMANLASTAQAAYDFSGSMANGEVNATQAGMFALASLGGMKLFKIVGKKFLKRFNCGKPGEHKICKIFESDGKRITTLRSTLGIGRRKNIAFVDYITTSGVGTMVAASGAHTHPGTVGMPSSPRYQTGFVGTHQRALDSEVKLYENMAMRFDPNTKGIARLVSELPICTSCGRVGLLFRRDFPKVFLMTRGGVTGRSRGR